MPKDCTNCEHLQEQLDNLQSEVDNLEDEIQTVTEGKETADELLENTQAKLSVILENLEGY